MAPQIIMIVFAAISLLLNAYLHGKPKEGKYSFWVTSIGWVIQMGLLWWGGFFNGMF